MQISTCLESNAYTNNSTVLTNWVFSRMALIQGQQLGSQVQQVENSVRAKYMGGPRG